MKRHQIIKRIGLEYLRCNTEKDEYDYKEPLEEIGKNHLDFIPENAIRNYQTLDIRFVKENISVLVETKKELVFNKLAEHIVQLQSYINFEKELTGNNIVAILCATNNNKLYIWNNVIEPISLDNYNIEERQIRTIQEYTDMFFDTKNNKLKIIQNTYKLNETLHKFGIKEEIRSQFVGSCLLALKNNMEFNKQKNKQIIGGIEDTLTELLNSDINKAEKLVILKQKVLDSQCVKKLTQKQFQKILKEIKDTILPYINDKNLAGQDLLNLFFTTFNKYVGKKDKNQAFTPDHITHFMAKVLNVNRKSIILDPCCGSGAFLVRAMTEALNDCDTQEEESKVKNSHIYGIEDEDKAYGLATTNMLIHGDGNSNIIKGSCFDSINELTKKGINTILMNPPYNATRNHCDPEYVETWGENTKQDPSKGFHFVYKVASKIGTGKLAVLLPVACAIGSNDKIQYFKEKMLEENTLEAVFSLPKDIFHPGSNSCACCMIFRLGERHINDKSSGTFFGYCRDDGFTKRKNIGRIERRPGLWKQIEAEWLNLFFQRKEVAGKTVIKKVCATDEWLAEAYMKTDYSILQINNFEQTIRDYLSYKIKNQQEQLSTFNYYVANTSNKKLVFNIKQWKEYKLNQIFKIHGSKTTSLEDLTYIYGIGQHPYVTTQAVNNGVAGFYDIYTEKGNCLVVDSAVIGFCTFQKRPFSASDHVEILQPKYDFNKYIALFLVTIMNLELYKYSYGRKRNQGILKNEIIKLPSTKDNKPDWKYMESFIKTLPLGEQI